MGLLWGHLCAGSAPLSPPSQENEAVPSLVQCVIGKEVLGDKIIFLWMLSKS